MDIDLTVIFNTHGTAEDALKLRPHIEDCDLHIPEIANWNWKFKLAIYRLSRGEISLDEFRTKFLLPEAQVEDSYYGVLYRTMYESHGETFIMEPPRSKDSLSNKQWLQQRQEARKFCADINNSTEDCLLTIRALLTRDIEHFRIRESYIVRNFRSRIAARIKNSVHLSRKNAVKVLFVIGRAHEAIYEQIAQQIKGPCRKIVIDEDTEVVSYRNLISAQNLRRMMISNNYSPTDDELIGHLFPKIIPPTPSH